jgi:hypothetical protein
VDEPFPVPSGDPEALRAVARLFRGVAEDHAALRTSVQRHVEVAGDGWTGGYADRFRGCAAQLSGRFNPVCETAVNTALTLSGYASILEEAQQDMTELNHQAESIGRSHIDPVDHAQSMSQLRQRAADVTDRLNGTASTCANRLAWGEQALQAALPDIASVAELLADVRRASARLRKDSPGAWNAVFGPDGFLRAWDERLHSPADLLAADLVVTRLIDGAEENEEDAGRLVKDAKAWDKAFPGMLKAAYDEEFSNVMPILRSGELTESELANKLQDFTRGWDRFWRFNLVYEKSGEEAAKAARFGVDGLKILGGTLDAAAIFGDFWTVAGPEDNGAAGWVDRGAAIANAGAAGVDLAELAGIGFSTSFIPGVGEVVGVATGLYLGGDWLYHHWTPFHDAADDTGHFTVSVAKDTWHAITSIF